MYTPPQVFVNALSSIVDSGSLEQMAGGDSAPPPAEGQRQGGPYGPSARPNTMEGKSGPAEGLPVIPGRTAPAGRSTALRAVLDFIAGMVSAGRVTVCPAFALRLLAHLAANAKAELVEERCRIASGVAVSAAPPPPAQTALGSSNGSKVGGGEEAVMVLIRAVGVWRIDEAAPPSNRGGVGRRGWGGDRLSVEVSD